MRALLMLLLALAVGCGLWFVGWWTVPVLALLWGLLRRHRSAPREAFAATLVAVLALLARDLVSPASGKLLAILGGVFPVPGIAVMGIALLLFALMAFAAARLAIGLSGVSANG